MRRYLVSIIVASVAAVLAWAYRHALLSGRVAGLREVVSALPSYLKVTARIFTLQHTLGGRLQGPPPAGVGLRDTDVWVVTPPKSGTTWVTHMAHQLRVRGALVDFEDQDDVVPWIEMLDTDFYEGTALNRNPNGEHVANPRVYKSHLAFSALPPGPYKKVFVFRDPLDALLSAAKFVPSLWGIPDPPSVEKLCSIFLLMGDVASMLKSLAVVWEVRHRDDVLLMFYEHIMVDRTSMVRRLAAFMQVPVDEDLISLVVKQTSHNEMAALHSVFANPNQARNMHRAQGLPLDLTKMVGKVRKDGGAVGQAKGLPESFAEACRKAWAYHAAVPTGFSSYVELISAHRHELQTERGLREPLVRQEQSDVPTVDITQLLLKTFSEPENAAHRRAAVSQELFQAASKWGVVKLVGHDINTSAVRAAGYHYFELPEELRGGSLRNSSVGFQRGFIPFAGESGLAETLEVKEGFVYGYEWNKAGGAEKEEDAGVARNVLQGPNLWPPESAKLDQNWRRTLQLYYDRNVDLARRLVEAILVALGETEVEAESKAASVCDGGETISQMRLFNYLPASYRPEIEPETQRLGSSPHTDWYLVTLILRDSASRLQVVPASDPDGPREAQGERWHDVPDPDGGEILALFGDYLSAFTGGRTHSPIHRVLLPQDKNSLSFVFFFSPQFGAQMIRPSESMRRPAWPKKFNTFLDQVEEADWGRSYGEYIQRKWSKVMSNR